MDDVELKEAQTKKSFELLYGKTLFFCDPDHSDCGLLGFHNFKLFQNIIKLSSDGQRIYDPVLPGFKVDTVKTAEMFDYYKKEFARQIHQSTIYPLFDYPNGKWKMQYCTLTRAQTKNPFFPLLLAAGFKKVVSANNTNSGNDIHMFVRVLQRAISEEVG